MTFLRGGAAKPGTYIPRYTCIPRDTCIPGKTFTPGGYMSWVWQPPPVERSWVAPWRFDGAVCPAPLCLWSAGAPDPEGDPRGAPPCPPCGLGVERWRSRSWGGFSWSALCSPCGCGALALQILRAILVERPPPPPVVVGWLWGAGAPDPDRDPCQGAAAPLWLWSAGAPDPEGDPRGAPSAPPVGVERWRSRS